MSVIAKTLLIVINVIDPVNIFVNSWPNEN